MVKFSDFRLYASIATLRFSVYSDVPCRVRFDKRVEVHAIVQGFVDFYYLEPKLETTVILVKQMGDSKSAQMSLYVRQGDDFVPVNVSSLSTAQLLQVIKQYNLPKLFFSELSLPFKKASIISEGVVRVKSRQGKKGSPKYIRIGPMATCDL